MVPRFIAATALVFTFLLGSLSGGAPARTSVTPNSLASGLSGVNLNGAVLAISDMNLERQYRAMRSAGVKYVRIPVNWALVQPEAGGRLDLRWLDRLVILGSKYGIGSLAFVYGAPPWAAASGGSCVRCITRSSVSATQPRDPNAFASFTKVLVKRYGPRGSIWKGVSSRKTRPISAWQIWNEPDLPSYWQSDKWAEEYGTLLATTRRAIRSADPKATVVLAGLTNYSPTALAELFQRGAIKGQFDVAAMNLFTKSAEDQALLLEQFRLSLIRGGQPDTPTWITEWTWLSGAAAYEWSFPPVFQASDLPVLMASSFGAFRRSITNGDRLQRAYWYTWASSYTGTYAFDYSGLNRLGADGVPTPGPGLSAWNSSAKQAR